MLKGKQGRFRQNLLGKRVDYSGRSVIVVGPELKLHQCGLPKKMALELFKPFVYSKLELYGMAQTIKAAKRMVEKERPEVWDILEQVIREHPVLLNRAPTLHRLGIQAFEPILIEGKAIQLHPLVCTAFNADFDGDQMAVHVPLSLESQLESRVLMMSTNNILSPANGKPIIVPTQDIVLGLYYLSLMLEDEPGAGMVFASLDEAMQALEAGVVSLHSKIFCRISELGPDGNEVVRRAETTPGRLLLFDILPKHPAVTFERLLNQLLTKREITEVVDEVYRFCGQKETVVFADRLMTLGFGYAARAGISFGKDDMLVPETKTKLVGDTQELVKQYEQQYADGLITKGEKYNKVVDAWAQCTDLVADEMMKEIKATASTRNPETGRINQPNSIYMMADSGARGSAAQIKQLAGMRGLMAKPSGEIIETPIISNFKEGLSVLEYFNSTHGARKGLADTALKTANSGYLTRRLVDVAQDCIIVEDDCGTEGSINLAPVVQGGEVIEELSQRILGRTTAEDVLHPVSGEVLVKRDVLLDEELVKVLDEAVVESLQVRSVLTCESSGGVCSKCYGRDLARGTPVNAGEAVGVIAAQSIGEPGTQLTMRTFHIGGAAQQAAERSMIESTVDGTMQLLNCTLVTDSKDRQVVLGRTVEMVLHDQTGREKARHRVPFGARLLVAPDAKVVKGERLAEWDPHTLPIITEVSGRAVFMDMVEGMSFREVVDEATGRANKELIDWRQQARGATLRPSILIQDEEAQPLTLPSGAEARYYLPVGAILNIEAAKRGPWRRRARPPAEGSQQDPRHHRWSAAGGRAVRGAQAQGSGDHRRMRRAGRVRQGLQDQAAAADRAEGGGCGADRVSDPQGAPRGGPGGRSDARRRPAGGRQPGLPRHPAGQGRRGPGGLPGQRDPGGLPAAGRDDQRQACRGDRPPDAAEDRDRRSGRHHLPGGRAGRQDRVRGGQRADDGGRSPAGEVHPGAAGHHQGVLADPVVHLGGLVPGDHPGADRCGVCRQARPSDGLEGERDRRASDPGGQRRGSGPVEAPGGEQRSLRAAA